MLSFHECVLNTSVYTTRSKRDKRGLGSSYLGALLSPKTTVSTLKLIPQSPLWSDRELLQPAFLPMVPGSANSTLPGPCHRAPRPAPTHLDPRVRMRPWPQSGGREVARGAGPGEIHFGFQLQQGTAGTLVEGEGGRVEAAPDSDWGLGPGIGLRVRIGCGFLQSRSAQ